MTAVPRTPSLLFANLVCMASMLVWAAGLPAADLLIDKVPPLTLTAARMAMAAAVLLPIWIIVEGRGALRGAEWAKGILIGGFTIGLGACALVIGQSLTDAVTVAIISASMPLVGIALEIIFDRRKITFALVFGLILSLLGGLMALGSGKFGIGIGIGALLCFVSVVTFTVGSRLTITSFPARTPLGSTTLTLTGAAILTGTLALIQTAAGGPMPDWDAIGWVDLGALAVFSIGALAISQVLWIKSVSSLGIGLASLHINAAPFYVMMILFAFGAAWNWTQTLAAAVVGLGVLVAQGLFLPQRK